MPVRCDNQYKIGAERGDILEQPRLFECMGICGLSPAHESEMRGYLVYVPIVKYLSHQFCLDSATVYQTGRPYRGILVGFFKTFLEGSVDRGNMVPYIHRNDKGLLGTGKLGGREFYI